MTLCTSAALDMKVVASTFLGCSSRNSHFSHDGSDVAIPAAASSMNRMGFMVCELIREKILLLLDEEIPHGVGVQLNKMSYDESRNLWDIDANIIVEKAGHKPIIIGRQGEKLKKIGSYARESIEKLTQGKVFLSLWVKVKEDWRNSEYVMKDIGYDKKQEF